MTKETPEIVIRGRRRESQAPVKTFSFHRSMVRVSGLSQGIQAFRDRAWSLFETLPMPDPKDEAWRRTDISGLQADLFRLPEVDAYLDLAPLDESLLSLWLERLMRVRSFYCPVEREPLWMKNCVLEGWCSPICALRNRITQNY